MGELENRMLGFRDSVNKLKLSKENPVLVMIDGRSFSKLIKNNFNKPFDDDFINYMNETACYVSKNIQGCKLAYTQSDEISFFIDAREVEETPFFEFRLCKMNSIIASMATGIFNKLAGDKLKKLAEFDCKVWNVNDNNDVFAWFLYRQLDCIRNSKQQTAQTWLSHKSLVGLNTDSQIKKLLEEKNINWWSFEDGKKYGRFIWKETEHHISEKYGEFDRSVWKSHEAWELNTKEGKEKIMKKIEGN